jgi:hypothetical protein
LLEEAKQARLRGQKAALQSGSMGSAWARVKDWIAGVF